MPGHVDVVCKQLLYKRHVGSQEVHIGFRNELHRERGTHPLTRISNPAPASNLLPRSIDLRPVRPIRSIRAVSMERSAYSSSKRAGKGIFRLVNSLLHSLAVVKIGRA